MSMEQLAAYVGLFRFRETPLELIVLSACETAQGDDRSALGLAGIAVKAGARSAVGTLWKVNDVAASELITAFYGRLADPSVSRAAALQDAQRKLLADWRYRHPGYWSAFVLISDWL
jgi:CHAT domain-containing protein